MIASLILAAALGMGIMYAFITWSVVGGALQDIAPGLFDALIGGLEGSLTSIGDTLATFLEGIL